MISTIWKMCTITMRPDLVRMVTGTDEVDAETDDDDDEEVVEAPIITASTA